MQNVVWREHTLDNIFVKKLFLSADSTIISKAPIWNLYHRRYAYIYNLSLATLPPMAATLL